MTGDRIVLYGDFNCPWSYLASRRAVMLGALGVEVDWRAVEHAPTRPGDTVDASARVAAAHEDIGRIGEILLPGERLPYALAGFVPDTGAAVAAYAEAYAAGEADLVRPVLFESLWLHAFDLDDPRVVRTLVKDAVRSDSSSGDPLRDWDYAVERGEPVTASASQLTARWRDEWRATGREVVPTLVVDGDQPVFGTDAVDWLAGELVRRDVDVAAAPVRRPPVAGKSGQSEQTP